MKHPDDRGWQYCNAETYAGDLCLKKAHIHYYAKNDGTCVKHFCTQHAKMYSPGVTFDWIERYVG